MEPKTKKQLYLEALIQKTIEHATQQGIEMQIRWGVPDGKYLNEDSLETKNFWNHSWC